MIPIRKAEVEDLLKHEHRPCITLVVSPGVKAVGLATGVAAYRALVRDALKQCERYRLGQIEEEALFEPLNALEKDTLFWQEHQHSVLIYRSEDLFRVEHRIAQWESRAIVDDVFHLRHLVADRNLDVDYHVLVVAKNKAELYHGSLDVLVLDDAKLVQSKKEITEASDNMRQQFHSAASPAHRGSGSNAFYTGAGEDNDEARQDQIRYLKALDGEVVAALAGSRDPLVLVGVEETMARYRKYSDYPNVSQETLRYQEEYKDIAKLHRDTLEVIKKEVGDPKAELVAKIDEEIYHPDGKVVAGLESLLARAEEGRIQSVMIAVDQESIRGYFDPVLLKVVEDDQGEDLVERLVRKALDQGASVYSAQETLAYLRY